MQRLSNLIPSHHQSFQGSTEPSKFQTLYEDCLGILKFCGILALCGDRFLAGNWGAVMLGTGAVMTSINSRSHPKSGTGRFRKDSKNSKVSRGF